jgi:hypothetical protein
LLPVGINTKRGIARNPHDSGRAPGGSRCVPPAATRPRRRRKERSRFRCAARRALLLAARRQSTTPPLSHAPPAPCGPALPRSGGNACLIAAGVVPFAIGTDGGGSVRIPSAVCGIVGLKPTQARPEEAVPAPLPPKEGPGGVLGAWNAQPPAFGGV